jgi:hypothetical protein
MKDQQIRETLTTFPTSSHEFEVAGATAGCCSRTI